MLIIGGRTQHRPRSRTGHGDRLVCVFLIALCVTTGLNAEPILQGKQVQQAGRIVIDEPFRVIRAHGPIKRDGETIQELGFQSIESALSGVERQTVYRSVAFSPDGRFIASGAEDNTIKLWDVKANRLIHTFTGHTRPVNSVAFSLDGRFIASGAEDNTVKLWDIGAKSLTHSFEGHKHIVSSVAFSSDGHFIASGAEDNTVKLWSVGTKSLVHTFEGHTYFVSSVAFSPNGRFIASGAWDNTVKLWDVGTKSLIRTLQGHEGSVYSVAFSPDGRFIASGAWDKTVKLWDVDANRLISTFEGHADYVYSVSFSPDGHFIASGSWDKTVKLWNVDAKGLINTFKSHTGPVYAVAFSKYGRFIASGAGDSTVKLWDVQAKRLVKTFAGHAGPVNSVAFSPDDRYVAAGARDNTIKLWDVDAERLINSFESHTQSVYSVFFSANGRFVASGAGDNTVKLWDIDAKRLISTFKGHTSSVNSVAFSPNYRFIASGAGDNSIKIWDVEAKSSVSTIEGHTGPINSVAFSPNGRLVASSARDNTVKIWDINARRLISTFNGHTSSVNSVAFSPSGRLIASGADDHTVKLWDVDTTDAVRTFKGHAQVVNSVTFSPDGRFIASSAGDGTVKHWDVTEETESNTLLAGRNGNWLSVNNQHRILRGDDGTFLGTRNKYGHWEPIPMSNIADQGKFSLSIDPQSPIIKPGETVELRITAKNNGPQAAFWLHLKPPGNDRATLRLDPPDNEFNPDLKGKRSWKPQRVAKLDPQETATLYAVISPNLKLPAEFIRPGISPLTVTVVSANGTEVSEEIDVDVQSPELQWQQATLEPDEQTLNIKLVNNGNLSLNEARVTFYLSSLDKAKRNPDGLGNSRTEKAGLRFASPRPLGQQMVAEILPEDLIKLALVLPEGFNLEENKLTLRGMTRDLPIYAWDLNAPKIQHARQLSQWLLVAFVLLTFTAIYYLRRYRHPLLMQLSNEPATLFELQPEQLREARTRLKQARRLATVLSKTDVTAKALDKSIDFVEKDSSEDKACWLAKRLGGEVSPLTPKEKQHVFPVQAGQVQSEGFQIRKLQLPTTFPLNMDRCLVCFPDHDIVAKDLFDDLKTLDQKSMEPILLVGPNSELRRKIYETSKDRSNNFVGPSAQALTRLLIGPDPEKTLAEVFAGQLALTQVSPYQLGGGVNREIVFFGRREMIANIMNRDPANYLLVGGRQVGKSTLLKALERRYREQANIDSFYFALSNEVLVPRLASALCLSSSSTLDEIATHVAKSKRHFVFLIDEADKFIAHERTKNYQILDALRRMSEEGHCNFILAGFWELYEHAVLDYRSPLNNFAEIIQVGALESEACRQLATEPMKTMGLQYASSALVDQLTESTGGRANLISIGCHEILNHLPLDQRTIHAADVTQALSSDKILNALKGWGAMTENEKTCRLDQIIVYAMIEKDRIDLAGLVDRLEHMNGSIDINAIEHSLSRLELGFLLGRDKSGRYFFQVPLFREMVKNDSPSVKLSAELGSWMAEVG